MKIEAEGGRVTALLKRRGGKEAGSLEGKVKAGKSKRSKNRVGVGRKYC